MADVIELSSDEEEMKGTKRKCPEDVTVIEDDEEDEKAKRLRMSPFKDDILVLDDEDQELDAVAENDFNALNVQKENGVEGASQGTEQADASEVFDLTNGANSEEEKEPAGAINGEQETSSGDKGAASEQPVEIDGKTVKFLDKCTECIRGNKLKKLFETKVPVFKKAYTRASEFVLTEEYGGLIMEKLEMVEKDPAKAVLCFQNVFKSLHSNVNPSVMSPRLKRLERMLSKLSEKMKKLEEAEVNFDDEENSSYLQLQKYRERAYKVFTAIKKIQNDDPNSGRAYYGRIDFAHSSYPEVNRALSKKYQNRDRRPFPTFEGVDKCIRKTIKQHNITIPENHLRNEIRSCFEALGNLLQKKRKLDLATVHLEYLDEVNEDPAQTDPELNKKLQENSKIYKGKMQSVIDKFETMQTEGVSVPLSEDSDNSNEPNSDDNSD